MDIYIAHLVRVFAHRAGLSLNGEFDLLFQSFLRQIYYRNFRYFRFNRFVVCLLFALTMGISVEIEPFFKVLYCYE